MRHAHFALTFAGACLALALAPAAVRAAPQSARSGANISSPVYNVRLEVLPDGSLDVVESVTLAVAAEPITSFDRTVSNRRTDGFTNVAAQMDGQSVPVSVDARRDLKIRWEFSPSANATHTFEIRYRALHALAREIDGPRLVWTALPDRHAYPIDTSEITVFAPAGSIAASVDAAGGAVLPSTAERTGLVIAGKAVAPDHTVAVDVTFAPNSIKPVEPQWFVDQQQRRDMMPAWLAAAACLLVVGVGILLMVFARLPRPPAPTAGLERERTRAGLLATGLVLIVCGLAGALAVWLFSGRLGPAPVSLPAVVVVVGVIYLVVARRMPVSGAG